MTEFLTNGWAGIQTADKAYSELQDKFITFRISGESPDKPGIPIWNFTKRLNNGEHIATLNQGTGDCVANGMAQAGVYGSAAGICYYGEPYKFKLWHPSYIYGVSRTAPDCGNGRLGWSAGSTGAWAAAAVMKYGVLFNDDPDVPKYSGSLSDQWGRTGVPDKFYKEASDNLVKSAARIDSVESIRAALINYYPVTIASSWGFSTSVKDNRRIYVHTTSWAHQMCFIAWQDDPFPAAYRLNSWGNSTGDPLNGEPVGGAWQPMESIEKEIRTGVELYVISRHEGFPAKSKFSLV